MRGLIAGLFSSDFPPPLVDPSGGSGIGFEIARQLGLHGASVVIMGRRMEFLEKAVDGMKADGIKAGCCAGDVRSEEDCKNAVDTAVRLFGKLDTLVNSAAGNFLAAAEELKPKGFRTVIDIDLIGVYNMSKAAFEPLKQSGQGSIINISATLHYGATWYQTHACAAKAAIDSVTRNLALEWGEYYIRVNGIAPGPIAGTAGLTKLAGGESPGVTTTVPLKRVGTTFDCGMAAVFLCSQAADFVSGDILIVDGANWLWGPPPAPREAIIEMSKKVTKL
jgi:peroxisomal 2,4-dienoyl-CoA reductase